MRSAGDIAQVLLGYPYNVAIDMWSLGCMAAELYLGLPLFPGASEHDLLVRIVDMLGNPPEHVLARAQHTRKYFKRKEELTTVGGVPMLCPKYKVDGFPNVPSWMLEHLGAHTGWPVCCGSDWVS